MTQKGRSLTHRTLSGLLWMSFGKGAYALLHLVVLAVLARLVSPADFGVISAALIVIGLSGIVSHIGLGPALVQRNDLEQRHIDTAFVASVLLGALLGAVVWLGAPLAARFFRIDGVEPVLRALAWLFPLQGLSTVAESLMRRDLRFRWLANRDVVSYAVGYGGVGITAASLGLGVWALVLGHLAHNIIKSGLLLIARPPRFLSKPDTLSFRELMYFGSGFTVAKIANQLAQQGDYLVVGRFLGPSALGYYGRAYNLMSAPASGFGTILDSVLFPAMARVQTELPRLAAAYRRGIALIALAVAPVSVALVLLAPEVIHVVLGPQWAPVIVPFQILAAGMLFRTSSKLADSLVRATGAVYRRAWRQALYAGMVIGGAVIGQRWGIVGVSWFVLLALAVNFLSMAHLSLSESEMPWARFWRAQTPAFLITLVTAPLVWVATSVLRNGPATPVVILGVGAAVVLGCSLVLIVSAPRIFFGEDAQWMTGTMRQFIKQRSRRPAVAGGVEGIAGE